MEGTTKFIALVLIGFVVATFADEGSKEATTFKDVEEQISAKNTTVVEGSGDTCSCSNQEAPVCASNGVTYKNSCRFDCTKKRVKRLRIVKNGKCGGLTLNQYRGVSTRRPFLF